MTSNNKKLTLHDKAAAITSSLIKYAQETIMTLARERLIPRKTFRTGSALFELIIFLLNLWMWYRSKDENKMKFVESLVFWTKYWLSNREGAALSDKSIDDFFKLLETRTVEYAKFRSENRDNESYQIALSTLVFSNMTGKHETDPLPIMQLWTSIKSYKRVIRELWEMIISENK